MSSLDFVADEIVTPASGGSRKLKRFSPGRLVVSSTGEIKSIEKFPKSKLASLSQKHKRVKCIIPGLIDPHTHLVYAGRRANEWGQRLKGVSYEQIARKGGGIKTTMKETRKESEVELLRLGVKRLKTFLKLGVTTLEIKSGYGLDFESELKVLKVINKLKKRSKVGIFSTFLGAHALPPEYSSTKDYCAYLIDEVLPKVKGLADFQDVFVERGYFKVPESVRLLNVGKLLGLKPKVHAHEFARSGGVEVAYKVGAVSADHLHFVNGVDIERMKKKKVVPVVLPGTSFFLGAKKFAPAKKMWDAGLPVAIASDYNPGTNPSTNLPLCGTFAAIHEGLDLDQILIAQTKHAALALDLRDRGVLEPKKRADFVCLDASSFEEIYYHYAESLVEEVYVGGRKAA